MNRREDNQSEIEGIFRDHSSSRGAPLRVLPMLVPKIMRSRSMRQGSFDNIIYADQSFESLAILEGLPRGGSKDPDVSREIARDLAICFELLDDKPEELVKANFDDKENKSVRPLLSILSKALVKENSVQSLDDETPICNEKKQDRRARKPLSVLTTNHTAHNRAPKVYHSPSEVSMANTVRTAPITPSPRPIMAGNGQVYSVPSHFC